ncbi:AraC family transcriptional regulator [Bacillus massilinigeriensis]|uniref:AraC family transcriptional regulator n=1 Tax=Bacillus massilionigeriensis TaxID=1805475 RepID=UPI00096B2661|nr:AraC family transcriptional regulator [Bacillus massilionigeriensis]
MTSTTNFEQHKSMIKKFLEIRTKNQHNFYFHPSFTLEQRLLSSIARGELEEAEKILNEINRLDRPILAKDTKRSLKNSLICSCTLFTRAIINGGVDPENAYNLSDAFIQKIEETDINSELIELEYHMLYTFIKTQKDQSKKSYQYVVNKAITYIHHEILNDLSLDKIASFLNIHPNYLSQVFKQEVGLNITEYINKKRIEDSKYFLILGSLPISDIANLFKFCNQSYYTSLFKKYCGITPKQYRVQYSDSSV